MEPIPHGTPEWHAARKKGIGASESAAALGLSPYKTPLELYLEKVGEAPGFTGNAATRRGQMMEPVVLDMYEQEKGQVIRNLPLIVSDRHPFLFASLDAQRVDDSRPVEAKTAGKHVAHKWGAAGSDEVPQDYLLQITHQMIVTGATVGDIAALITLDDFRVYSFEIDRELAEMIVEGLRAFWQRVENREPPPPTTGQEAAVLYRQSRPEGLEATPEILQAYRELMDTRAMMKPLTEREEKLTSDIKLYLGERDTLTAQGVTLATWKTAKAPERFNAKLFESEHPELYRSYLYTGQPSRKFLIKGE